MKKKRSVIPITLIVAGLIVALSIYFVWRRDRPEVQIQETRGSSDGKWMAVVQLEVGGGISALDDPVYAVRLRGPAQKDRQGDLVMNVPVNYPDPAPTVAWSSGKLVVTLIDHQKYQYLANPVSGVPVDVKQK